MAPINFLRDAAIADLGYGLKRPGTYGGIILVDGNALEELKLRKPLSICEPRRERSIETIPFVMKDGNIYCTEVYTRLFLYG
jgi:hypothetical protein